MTDSMSPGIHSEGWLAVVAAVEYLSRGPRVGLTVWDACEEAIRWWITDRLTPSLDGSVYRLEPLPWNDPDPLRSSIEWLLATVAGIELPDGHALPDVLTSALQLWVARMADLHNDGYAFTAPGRAPDTFEPSALWLADNPIPEFE